MNFFSAALSQKKNFFFSNCKGLWMSCSSGFLVSWKSLILKRSWCSKERKEAIKYPRGLFRRAISGNSFLTPPFRLGIAERSKRLCKRRMLLAGKSNIGRSRTLVPPKEKLPWNLLTPGCMHAVRACPKCWIPAGRGGHGGLMLLRCYSEMTNHNV